MNNNYSFPGEVTMSIEEYKDIVLKMHDLEDKANTADMYRGLYNSEKKRADELQKKLDEDKF